MRWRAVGPLQAISGHVTSQHPDRMEYNRNVQIKLAVLMTLSCQPSGHDMSWIGSIPEVGRSIGRAATQPCFLVSLPPRGQFMNHLNNAPEEVRLMQMGEMAANGGLRRVIVIWNR